VSMLFESCESLLMLCDIANFLELIFFLRVLFFKELLLKLLDVLSDVFEHPSDVKFIIWEIVNENCLIPCNLLHTIIIFIRVFLILTVLLNLEVLPHFFLIQFITIFNKFILGFSRFLSRL
jgi:hypothetical protein